MTGNRAEDLNCDGFYKHFSIEGLTKFERVREMRLASDKERENLSTEGLLGNVPAVPSTNQFEDPPVSIGQQ